MWDSAIQHSTQRVTDALLHRDVLPRDSLAFEKITGALAVRAALQPRSKEQSLLFVVPELTATTATHVVAALLVGDHAHANGQAELPEHEVKHLLRGDIVVVTHAISDSKAKLEELRVGRGQRISDLWEIATLSRYTPSRSQKPRVFLTNPGWLNSVVSGRRFGAVVIDASHPNSLAHLPELLRAASGCTSLRIAVAPPPNQAALDECRKLNGVLVWLWDPQAQQDAQIAVEENDKKEHAVRDRFLWVCDSDADAAAALASLSKGLAGAARAANGHGYPGLRQCWGIYNRLRQVTVPLAHLEQASVSTWAGNLRKRIEELDTVSGHGNVAWDTTWPQLLDSVRNAYQTLLKREETAKFWALAGNLEDFLRSGPERIRVVVSSEAEIDLLVASLEAVVDGLSEAVASGHIAFVTANQDARLVAEGKVVPTVLLSPRTQAHRHLDLFPSTRVDELLYPHEVDSERSALASLYAAWRSYETDEHRVQILEPLGFAPPKSSTVRKTSASPKVVVKRSNGHAVSLVTEGATSPDINVDGLVEASLHSQLEGWAPSGGTCIDPSGAATTLEFVNGATRSYYGHQKVDVYLSATASIERHVAKDVRPGWQVITFVDGQYDGLFQRLADLVNSRLPPSERVALALWRKSKANLLKQFENKSELYEKLKACGLTSSLATFSAWFRIDDDDVIAPQQLAEFRVLATTIETYARSEDMLKGAWSAIQHERGRHRAMGRALRNFLRAVISGEDYEAALSGARHIDAALGDILAAVEVLEVAAVRENQRSQYG